MKNIFRLLIAALLLASYSPPAFSQPAQPFNPNFLDLDDDEDMPPGAPVTPGAQKKTFGDTSQPPAGDFGQGASGSGSGPGGKALPPTPRRNRKEPPNLKASRPGKMVDASDRDITDENFPDLIDSFDYPNAEVGDIVKAISELTGKNFIIDPAVKGKITIIAPSRITVAEAYKAFLSALAINGMTVVPSGKFLKVKPSDKAKTDNLDTYSGAYAPSTDTMITRIIQLRYVQAKEIYNSLGPLLQSRLGEMRFYEPTNTLIISDYGSNIERVMKILRQLDVPGFEEQMVVIRVKYAKAADLAKLIDQIINKGKSSNQSGGGFTAGIPRFSPLGGSSSGSSSEAFSLVIPDDRTNSLIVVGNTSGLQKIKRLVSKLDFKIRPEDGGGVYVYYIKFGDAEKIATTLAGLAQASTQAQSSTQPMASATGPAIKSQAVFGGDVKIVADKTTNSLVITASKQDYEVVTSILDKLDIPRDQVYVQSIIMEMAVDSSRKWGVNIYNFGANSWAARAGISTMPVGTILDPTNDAGAILGFGNGSTVNLTMPGAGGSAGTTIPVPSLVGLINLMSQQTATNILSTPSIMALDNEEASIEVGANVPLNQTTTQAAGVSGVINGGFERRDVVINLKIKPHISPGSNTLRLEIEKKIEKLGQAATFGNATSYSVLKRMAKTSVLVRDNDTLVLGGLMEDEDGEAIKKVPVLGDIPIIGWLFKGKEATHTKKNMVIFLTPKIIRQPTDAAKASDSSVLVRQKLKERVNFIEQNVGGKDTQGDLIDKLHLEQGPQ